MAVSSIMLMCLWRHSWSVVLCQHWCECLLL